jgi:hypothetical protein
MDLLCVMPVFSSNNMLQRQCTELLFHNFPASKIDPFAFIFDLILTAELLCFFMEEILPQLSYYNTTVSLILLIFSAVFLVSDPT